MLNATLRNEYIYGIIALKGCDVMAKRKAEWQNNYIAKTYDRINLIVPKGEKDEIKAKADRNGESVNAYINRLLDQDKKSSP